MGIALIKNLSFRSSLFLTGEVVKQPKQGPKQNERPETNDPSAFTWWVEVLLAIPSEKSRFSKKRVRFPDPEKAKEALEELVDQINELEQRDPETEDDSEEETDDDGDEEDI